MLRELFDPCPPCRSRSGQGTSQACPARREGPDSLRPETSARPTLGRTSSAPSTEAPRYSSAVRIEQVLTRISTGLSMIADDRSHVAAAFAHGDEVLAPISDRFDHHLRIVRQGRRTIVDRQVHDHDTVAARPKPRATRCLYQPMSPASWIGTWVAMAVSGRVADALQLSDLDRRPGLLVESGAVGRSCRRNLMRQLASVLGPGSVMPERSRDRHIPTF